MIINRNWKYSFSSKFFIIISVLYVLIHPHLRIEKLYALNFEDPLHGYYKKIAEDPFSKIIKKIENGSITLNYDSNYNYLNSLLRELNITPESQLLVYSNTSLQLSRISPRNPRAIYFSDDIYLGYVPGGQVEIIGIDPQIGAIPYIFNLPHAQDLKHPPIYRSKRCMKCHASKEMGGSPGLLIGSAIPGPGGGSIDAFRRKLSGHEVPFDQRFGGWHITGNHPFENSWANHTGMIENGTTIKIPNPPGMQFNWGKYLTKHSDIIPHLILEHQVGFTNRCLSVTYRFRELSKLKNKPTYEQKVEQFVEKEAKSLLSYILFQNEAFIPKNTINPNTKFADFFVRKGITSLKGYSLNTLNLKNRLFNLRCSYMIFSNSFNGLPLVFKSHLLKKLNFILSCNTDQLPPKFSYMEENERIKIKAILSESLDGFPKSTKKDAYWRPL